MSLTFERVANIAVVVVAACTVVVTATYMGGSRGSAPRPTPDSVAVSDWRSYLTGGHDLGPESALVTILEFGDYECPFCAKFASEIEKILAAFPSEVRFVYRHWPLEKHRFAYPAARAAECAHDQNRFWEYHRLLFSKRDSLGLLSFSEIGQRAGVPSLSTFDRCARTSSPLPEIERAKADARKVGGSGTPTIVVNGILYWRFVDSTFIAELVGKLRDQR